MSEKQYTTDEIIESLQGVMKVIYAERAYEAIARLMKADKLCEAANGVINIVIEDGAITEGEIEPLVKAISEYEGKRSALPHTNMSNVIVQFEGGKMRYTTEMLINLLEKQMVEPHEDWIVNDDAKAIIAKLRKADKLADAAIKVMGRLALSDDPEFAELNQRIAEYEGEE